MRALGERDSVETDVLPGRELRRAPAEVMGEGGPTLGEIAAACRKARKSLPVGLVLSAVHDAALGLAVVHASVGGTHGLISDGSIAVDFEGKALLLNEGLFGAHDPHQTPAEAKRMAAPYLAPEQLLRGQFPDARSDVFSLAALLHELLSGAPRAQVGGPSELYVKTSFLPPSALNVALGPRVDEVVLRALSTDPAQRHATAVDFAVALRRAAADQFWQPALRAQFVGALFPEGRDRHQVLGVVIPLPRRRASVPPTRATPRPLRSAALELEFADSEDVVLCGDALGKFEDDGSRDDWDDDLAPPSRWRAVALALLAAGLAWVWQQHLPLYEPGRAGQALAARVVRAWPSAASPSSATAKATAKASVVAEQRLADPSAPEPAPVLLPAIPPLRLGFVPEGPCAAEVAVPLRPAACAEDAPEVRTLAKRTAAVKRKAAIGKRLGKAASRLRRGRR